LRRLAEFGDVGAGDERLTLADQHDGFDRAVVDGLLHALHDAGAQLLRQCVHRRIVQRKHADFAFDGEIDHGVDSHHQCVSQNDQPAMKIGPRRDRKPAADAAGCMRSVHSAGRAL
jgi:hypothetical protein